MNKIEIINETVKFYSNDPYYLRSVDEDNNCAYNNTDNRHCAVGRCLMYKYRSRGKKLKGNYEDLTTLSNVHKISFDKMLSPKYRGHDICFWIDLQELHDIDSYWNSNGLSIVGEEFVQRLKLIYGK